MQRYPSHGAPLPILSRDRSPLRNALAGTARIALACLAVILWLPWQAIRLPLLTFLVILEPIVSFLLSALALLIALSALFWEFTDPKPHFPFWTVISGSFASVLVLALYHALMRALCGGAPFRSRGPSSTAQR